MVLVRIIGRLGRMLETETRFAIQVFAFQRWESKGQIEQVDIYSQGKRQGDGSIDRNFFLEVRKCANIYHIVNSL